MNIALLADDAAKLIRTNRVFADPVTVDDTTIITVARVGGGGGGGSGSGPAEDGTQGEGSGAGLGFTALPAGAYVIRGGRVSWKPAIDVNRLVAVSGAVLITALLTARSVLRSRCTP